jgi:hypothetical protein
MLRSRGRWHLERHERSTVIDADCAGVDHNSGFPGARAALTTRPFHESPPAPDSNLAGSLSQLLFSLGAWSRRSDYLC